MLRRMTIGPAGENLVRFATVQHAEENAAGHSGFGAVWGSTNLKAITVRGTKVVSVADPKGLLREIVGAGTGKTTPPVAVTFEGGKMWLRDADGQGRTRSRNGGDAACARHRGRYP